MAYGAYCAATALVSPLPAWEELTQVLRDAWELVYVVSVNHDRQLLRGGHWHTSR